MAYIENIDDLKPGEMFYVNHDNSGLLPKKKLFYMIYLKRNKEDVNFLDFALVHKNYDDRYQEIENGQTIGLFAISLDHLNRLMEEHLIRTTHQIQTNTRRFDRIVNDYNNNQIITHISLMLDIPFDNPEINELIKNQKNQKDQKEKDGTGGKSRKSRKSRKTHKTHKYRLRIARNMQRCKTKTIKKKKNIYKIKKIIK
uniref:Uncharacterized protein n=1 Tax=viral metagenome TaxID=1070528 RepID=A0A6C0E2H1_9ZZZZ